MAGSPLPLGLEVPSDAVFFSPATYHLSFLIVLENPVSQERKLSPEPKKQTRLLVLSLRLKPP